VLIPFIFAINPFTHTLELVRFYSNWSFLSDHSQSRKLIVTIRTWMCDSQLPFSFLLILNCSWKSVFTNWSKHYRYSHQVKVLVSIQLIRSPPLSINTGSSQHLLILVPAWGIWREGRKCCGSHLCCYFVGLLFICK